MRVLHPARLLLCALVATPAIAPTAFACGQLGVSDQISRDGQSITSRKLIALRQQAIRHGGYDQAIEDMQQIRDDLMRRDGLSPRVRHRLQTDLEKNIGLLRCWSATCTDRADEPDCQF
jgi:hypothetical protein